MLTANSYDRLLRTRFPDDIWTDRKSLDYNHKPEIPMEKKVEIPTTEEIPVTKAEVPIRKAMIQVTKV